MNKNNFFEQIISLENLFSAWEEFLCGKKKRKDVAEFSMKLSENVFSLHEDLLNKTYVHGPYHAFNISDPKPRSIHKATVRDRLLHHAIYRILYPYFDKKFIYDSYSCRNLKGTHRALDRFTHFSRKVSENNTKTVWVLKCDVRKFFASIDHAVLLNTLKSFDLGRDTLRLLHRVIISFNSGVSGKGLPLGNLTSQLLVNVYMDWFDQYMKHRIGAKYYIRYADDFVVMSVDKIELENMLLQIGFFLKDNLELHLHPNKVFIKTVASGLDFLGWVHFPHHRVLRTVTKRRMFNKLKNNASPKILASYKGMLKWGNTYKIQNMI